jgi:uncharacterized protein (TIGR02611 family)
MKQVVRVFRKAIILAIGVPLLLLGIVLIPLPGPGVLVMVIALAVLSLEFDQARKHLEKAKATLKKIYDKSKARADKIANLKD